MRFATRLTMVMAVLAVASAFALSAIVSRLVDRSVEERARERLLRESALLAAELSSLGDSAPSLDSFSRRAAAALGARVTVVRSDGVVVADSEVPADRLAALENHRNRPEIVEARSNASGFSVRHSATLGRDLFYLARRIDNAGGVVRLALPYDELRHVESEYEWGARAAIALVCALLFLTGSAALSALSRPLRRLSDDALAIASGDTAHGLPEDGPREIGELSSAMNRMRQSLLGAAARIEGERRLGAAVFDTLPDGTVIVDRQLRIVDANPRFRELLRAECTPGQPLIDAVRERDTFMPFEEAVKGGASARTTVVRPGEVTWEVSVHPLSSERAAAVGIVHDVTPMRRSEAMRRRFVADISHELRTPVASIAAAAETLAAQPLDDDETLSLIAVIGRQATRMAELLDDLTDLTLIESGQIALDKARVDLAAVALEVAHDVEPAAAAHGVTIAVDGEETPVSGDPRRIAQIVRNLLDNAVKFSPEGSAVRVSVAQSATEAVIAVSDSGEGIPDREISRIFQRFYQVDRSRSKTRPGSGLGLAIVKHLAQLHGAHVDVESAVGVGSTFRVHFPRVQEKT